jgi:DNA-binding NtrC family response regulator
LQDSITSHVASLEKPSKLFYQILVVDDEDTVRHLLRAMLNGEGYTEVDDAASAQDALKALSEQEYHLMLLDKNLPGTDGMHVLREAKKIWPAIEIIVITAYGSLESAMQAMDLGAYSYITKPFTDLKVLMGRVEGALDRVAVKYQSNILLGRLERVLEQLKGVEGEMDQQVIAAKVRNAADRLQRITAELRSLGPPARDDSEAGSE